MTDMSNEISKSPRSAARARLKQKHEDEPWKKQYDLAVKQSLGLRLATPEGDGKNRRKNAFDNDRDQQDMDDILAPSFEGGGQQTSNNDHQEGRILESTSSADDSIIRRVEEEIAAARKAASGVNRKLQSPKRSSPTVVHIPGGAAETVHASLSSSSEDSSRALALENLIQDEFQQFDDEDDDNNNRTTTLNETQGSNGGVHIEMVYGQQQEQQENHMNITANSHNKPRHPTPEQLYFTDEEWQVNVEGSNPSDEVAQSSSLNEPQPQQTYKSLTVETLTLPDNQEETDNIIKTKSPEHSNAPPSLSNKQDTEDRQEEEPNQKSSSNQDQNNSSPQSCASSSKRDSPASSVARNKDPEGVYSRPKEAIASPATANCGTPNATFEAKIPESPSLSAASRNSHQKTRELLDSLREQRAAISTPKRRGNDVSPQKRIPSSPTPLSRSTRARERVKTNHTRTTENTTEMSDSQRKQQTPSPHLPNSRTQSPRWTAPISPRRKNSETSEALSAIDAEPVKRIRFRNPFPVIKNPNTRRDAAVIAHDNSVGVQEMPIKWVKPKQELKQLIVAAMGTSLPRRSNACGALKVLTQQPKNQLALVRTDGFLSALIFAASQSLVDIDRDLAIDARTRAVKCLKNVASPKDNRVLMMNHPGVLECLVKVIKTDGNEGRATATATVALLAKTPVCREGLAQVEGLIDVISKVVHGHDSFPLEESQPLANNSAVRRKLNYSVSDFSTQSGSNAEEENENQENINDNGQHEPKKNASIEESESSDDEEGSDDDDEDDQDGEEDQDYLTQPPPVEITHQKASPQLDSIRNKLEVRHQEFANQSRANACATLLHFSRQCTISPQLCSKPEVLASLSAVACEVTTPIHSKCIEILCNLSRFPHNCVTLTNFEGMIDLLVAASSSAPADNRLNALRTLQNLSADPPSKRHLATTQVLNLMTSCAMRKDANEKEVAVATIYNICTEPSAVTAITNTKNVVATLVHLAHSPESSSTIRLLACEALATISLWLQTLAGTGTVPDGVSSVPLPSQKTSGWDRWD